MHTCPFCGEECDCDMDDTGGLPVPDDCPHVCDEPVEEDFLREDEDENEDGVVHLTDLVPHCIYCGAIYWGGYCWQSPDGNHHMSSD